jgi:hypothetical protein
MIKITKPKLQFIVGAFLFMSFTIAACNTGEKKETVKDEPAVTTTAPPEVRDSSDTMEKIKGAVSPVEEVKPK